MQLLAAVAVLTGLALLPGPVGPDPELPEIGEPAPAFTLVDAHGKKHSLSEYKGKMVVIEWVNIACPTAKANYETGIIPQLQKRYEAKGVVWLSMIATQRQQDEFGGNLISEERAKALANDMVDMYGASPTATLIDVGGAVSVKYATATSMHMFVIDRQGALVYDGALDTQFESSAPGKEKNYVATALDETMAGKPVTTSITMPYGCHTVADNLVPGADNVK